MNLTIKKIFAFGLLVVMITPVFFAVTIIIKQQVLHYQVQQRLEAAFLQSYTISAENLIWVKKGKEVILEGRLFDVQSFKKNGTMVTLTGFFDSKEDKLVRWIKSLMLKKETSSPFDQLAIKFLFLPVYSGHPQITLTGNNPQCKPLFLHFSERIPEPPFLSFSPPPKL